MLPHEFTLNCKVGFTAHLSCNARNLANNLDGWATEVHEVARHAVSVVGFLGGEAKDFARIGTKTQIYLTFRFVS